MLKLLKAAQAVLVFIATLVNLLFCNMIIAILAYIDYQQENNAYCLCKFLLAVTCLAFSSITLWIISLTCAVIDVIIAFRAITKK